MLAPRLAPDLHLRVQKAELKQDFAGDLLNLGAEVLLARVKAEHGRHYGAAVLRGAARI